MKLTYEAMQILMEELQQNEMWAIYLMGLGKEMTEKITKTDLTNIIWVLCKNLQWIEVSRDDLVNDRENTTAVNQNGNISSDLLIENVSSQPIETVEYTPTKDESENHSQEDVCNTEIETEPNCGIETVGFPIVNTTEEMHENQQDISRNLSFDCSVCDQKFSKENYLEAHIFMKHDNQKKDQPLKCSYCAKEFKQYMKLMIHERIHTGDKPFSCSQCGKKFSQSQNVKIHERIHKW